MQRYQRESLCDETETAVVDPRAEQESLRLRMALADATSNLHGFSFSAAGIRSWYPHSVLIHSVGRSCA